VVPVVVQDVVVPTYGVSGMRISIGPGRGRPYLCGLRYEDIYGSKTESSLPVGSQVRGSLLVKDMAVLPMGSQAEVGIVTLASVIASKRCVIALML